RGDPAGRAVAARGPLQHRLRGGDGRDAAGRDPADRRVLHRCPAVPVQPGGRSAQAVGVCATVDMTTGLDMTTAPWSCRFSQADSPGKSRNRLGPSTGRARRGNTAPADVAPARTPADAHPDRATGPARFVSGPD